MRRLFSPFTSLTSLKRTVVEEDPRKIFLLYEGENTERLLINPLLASENIIRNNGVIFKPIDKTENDKGTTHPYKLIEAANNFIVDNIKNKKFNPVKDKVLVVFDLDVFKGNQDKIDALLTMKREEVILGFSNPAIELFLLLTKKNAFQNIIKKHYSNILENKRTISKKTGLETKHGDRYVVTLVKKYLKINPKKHDTNYVNIINNINNAFIEEKHINELLSDAGSKITCNLAYIIKKISDDDFDIKY